MATYDRGETVQPVELAGGDVPIDGDLDQVGLRQRRRRADDDGDECHRDLAASTAAGSASSRRISRAS